MEHNTLSGYFTFKRYCQPITDDNPPPTGHRTPRGLTWTPRGLVWGLVFYMARLRVHILCHISAPVCVWSFELGQGEGPHVREVVVGAVHGAVLAAAEAPKDEHGIAIPAQ